MARVSPWHRLSNPMRPAARLAGRIIREQRELFPAQPSMLEPDPQEDHITERAIEIIDRHQRDNPKE